MFVDSDGKEFHKDPTGRFPYRLSIGGSWGDVVSFGPGKQRELDRFAPQAATAPASAPPAISGRRTPSEGVAKALEYIGWADLAVALVAGGLLVVSGMQNQFDDLSPWVGVGVAASGVFSGLVLIAFAQMVGSGREVAENSRRAVDLLERLTSQGGQMGSSLKETAEHTRRSADLLQEAVAHQAE